MISTADAQLPVIQLHALSQSVFETGREYDISVSKGTYTDEVTGLRFSHPAISADLKTDPPRSFAETPTPKYGSFLLRIAPAVPAGRYDVRAVGRFGVSNPRSILIADHVRLVSDVGHDFDSEAECVPDVIHHRSTTAQKRDVYWLDVDPGQSISIHLLCESIDSRMIGSVVVYDSTGHVLESAIGSQQGDLYRTFKVPPEVQRVAIAVQDALFRGGSEFGYGLRVTKPAPDARSSGVSGTGFSARTASPLHPRTATALTPSPSIVPESTEATRLSIPFTVESTFDSPRDEDHFVCEMLKGHTIRIEVFSDRLGEPTDTRVIVYRQRKDAAGELSWQRVATGEDCQNVTDGVVHFGSRDTDITYTAPETGAYRITVSDQDSGESLAATQRYLLKVAPPEIEPQLVAYHLYPHKDLNVSRPSGVHLPRGGAMVIRVFAIRNGYVGPIRVSIPEVPAGLSCKPATIHSGRNQTDLIVTTAEDAQTMFNSVTVKGTFAAGDSSRELTAKTVAVLWEKNGHQPSIQSRLIDELMIAASELDQNPVNVGPANDQMVEVIKGSKAKVPIKVERHDGTKNDIVLRARNLPAGVKAGDLTIKGDQTDAEWAIDVTGGTKPGTYTFWGQGETKVKFAVNPQSLTRKAKYRERLKKLREDPSRSADHAAIDQAIAEADKEIESVKKQTTAKDFTIYLATPAITLKVNEK